MAADVLTFPDIRPPREIPQWLPADVRREAARIEQWVSVTQHRLAGLEGATPDHHKVIRTLGNLLRRELLEPWQVD